MDPFERAPITSNTYYDWMIRHAFLVVPTQEVVGQFMATFKEFPPRQKPASFSVEQVMDLLGPAGRRPGRRHQGAAVIRCITRERSRDEQGPTRQSKSASD